MPHFVVCAVTVLFSFSLEGGLANLLLYYVDSGGLHVHVILLLAVNPPPFPLTFIHYIVQVHVLNYSKGRRLASLAKFF